MFSEEPVRAAHVWPSASAESHAVFSGPWLLSMALRPGPHTALPARGRKPQERGRLHLRSGLTGGDAGGPAPTLSLLPHSPWPAAAAPPCCSRTSRPLRKPSLPLARAASRRPSSSSPGTWSGSSCESPGPAKPTWCGRQSSPHVVRGCFPFLSRSPAFFLIGGPPCLPILYLLCPSPLEPWHLSLPSLLGRKGLVEDRC